MVSLPPHRQGAPFPGAAGAEGTDGGENPRQTDAYEAGRSGQVMLTTTLSFQNMHQHGDLFVNLLRARRKSFIIRNNWRLPEAEGMEFDQYDTPASRWIAVHDGGEVLAGVRLTPTTARVGMYTYMIRDAQRGRGLRNKFQAGRPGSGNLFFSRDLDSVILAELSAGASRPAPHRQPEESPRTARLNFAPLAFPCHRHPPML